MHQNGQSDEGYHLLNKGEGEPENFDCKDSVKLRIPLPMASLQTKWKFLRPCPLISSSKWPFHFIGDFEISAVIDG